MAINNLSVVAVAHPQQRLPALPTSPTTRAARWSTPTRRRRPGATTRSSSAARAPRRTRPGRPRASTRRASTGRRLDWLIGDDVITPANAFSPAKRESALTHLGHADHDPPRARRAARSWPGTSTTRTTSSRRCRRASPTTPSSAPRCTSTASPSWPANPRDPRARALWPENWDMERLTPRAAREAEPLPAHLPAVRDRRAGREAARALDAARQARGHAAAARRFYIVARPRPRRRDRGPRLLQHHAPAPTTTAALTLVESYSLPRRHPAPGRADRPVLRPLQPRRASGVVAIGGAKVAHRPLLRRGRSRSAAPTWSTSSYAVSVPGHKEERLEALGPYAQVRLGALLDRRLAAAHGRPADRFQEMSLYEEWKAFPLGRHDDRLDGLDVLIRCAREQGWSWTSSTS